MLLRFLSHLIPSKKKLVKSHIFLVVIAAAFLFWLSNSNFIEKAKADCYLNNLGSIECSDPRDYDISTDIRGDDFDTEIRGNDITTQMRDSAVIPNSTSDTNIYGNGSSRSSTSDTRIYGNGTDRPQTTTQSNCTWDDLYPECKPGTNLACRAERNSCTGEYRHVKDCWKQPGVCGNPSVVAQPQPAQRTQPQPAQTQQAVANQPQACSLINQTYPECGSWCGEKGRQAADVLSMVTRNVNPYSCQAVYSCDIRGRVPGQCGVPVPQPQPATIAREASPARAASTAPVQIVAVQTPVPAVAGVGQAVDNRVECPSGTQAVVRESTIVCVQQVQNQINNQNVVVHGAVANASTGPITVNVPAVTQPQVVYTQVAGVQQLPKTGLPVSALLLTGLLPIGVGLSHFKKIAANVITGHYLWQEREFLRK